MSLNEYRSQLVTIIKISEKSQRYEEMWDTLQKIIELNIGLTLEERSLLGISFRNILIPLRNSIQKLREKEDHPLKDSQYKMLEMYRKKLESSIESNCLKMLKLLNDHLIPTCQDSENKVFYCKMYGY